MRLPHRDDGGNDGEGSDGEGEPGVAFAKDVELVGAGLLPERFFAKFDIVVMRDVETRGNDDEQSGEEEDEFVIAREAHPEQMVGSRTDEPQKSDGMSEKHDGREQAGGDDAVSAHGPDESESNGGEAERQVVVHEDHVEDVAIG